MTLIYHLLHNQPYKKKIDLETIWKSVKLIGDVSLVVPRYNWSSGTFYDEKYDDGASTNTSEILCNQLKPTSIFGIEKFS